MRPLITLLVIIITSALFFVPSAAQTVVYNKDFAIIEKTLPNWPANRDSIVGQLLFPEDLSLRKTTTAVIVKQMIIRDVYETMDYNANLTVLTNENKLLILQQLADTDGGWREEEILIYAPGTKLIFAVEFATSIQDMNAQYINVYPQQIKILELAP